MSNIKAISTYLKHESVVASFAGALGGTESGALAYVAAVIVAVANDTKLQKCTKESIYIQSIRAATLKLSCDPGMRQAYLVPFGNKATLIIGYKGLYDLAVRTGRYRFIHVHPIKQGIHVIENPITGEVTFEGTITNSKENVGWLASFKMTPEFGGLEKSLYMSVEDIHEHKEKYSKGHDRTDSAWKTAKNQMERKTVLRRLINDWGYIDPVDAALFNPEAPEAISDDVIDIPVVEVEDDKPKTTMVEDMLALGGTPGEKEFNISLEQLGVTDIALVESLREDLGDDYLEIIKAIRQNMPPKE